MAPFRTVTFAISAFELLQDLRLRFAPILPLVKAFFCFLCRMLFAFFIGFALVYLLRLFLSLPINPNFPTLQLDSATVTPLNTNINAVNLTATLDVTFVFQNPNHKLAVWYRDFEANLRFGNDNLSLASTHLPPFSQGADSATRVRAQLNVVDGFSTNAGLAKGIAAERARGSVNFGMTLSGWVGFKYGLMQSTVSRLNVECDHVLIVFPTSNNNTGTGTLVGPSYCRAV